MGLLVLQAPTESDEAPRQQYRGTYRGSVYYTAELPESHPVNQAFLWYASTSDPLDTAGDFERARELVDLHAKATPLQHLELIEVATDRGEHGPKDRLLGYDLSHAFHYSILSWGLDIDHLQGDVPAKTRDILMPLLRLIKMHFQPLLNANGLFDDYDTAAFCLSCMLALQEILPHLWEHEDVDFEVVGLWKLYP